MSRFELNLKNKNYFSDAENNKNLANITAKFQSGQHDSFGGAMGDKHQNTILLQILTKTRNTVKPTHTFSRGGKK